MDGHLKHSQIAEKKCLAFMGMRLVLTNEIHQVLTAIAVQEFSKKGHGSI